MEQHLSWSKAYIVSAALHFVIFLLFAVGLAVVVAEKEQQVYEIDLQASDFSQGSGHEGGGSSENLFPEPLKAEEVAKRVETVQQTVSPITPTETAVPTQDAVTVPQAVSETAAPSSAAAPAAAPSSAVGTGSGEGSGTGTGMGTGTGSGYMAMKRRLEGTTTIVTTISTSGDITSVSVASSSGHGLLDDAAVAAAYAVGSYPNPTGATVSVTTNVSFSIR